jgi:hypothetical protein
MTEHKLEDGRSGIGTALIEQRRSLAERKFRDVAARLFAAVTPLDAAHHRRRGHLGTFASGRCGHMMRECHGRRSIAARPPYQGKASAPRIAA